MWIESVPSPVFMIGSKSPSAFTPSLLQLVFPSAETEIPVYFRSVRSRERSSGSQCVTFFQRSIFPYGLFVLINVLFYALIPIDYCVVDSGRDWPASSAIFS